LYGKAEEIFKGRVSFRDSAFLFEILSEIQYNERTIEYVLVERPGT
jgi:hypothetical protein